MKFLKNLFTSKPKRSEWMEGVLWAEECKKDGWSDSLLWKSVDNETFGNYEEGLRCYIWYSFHILQNLENKQ